MNRNVIKILAAVALAASLAVAQSSPAQTAGGAKARIRQRMMAKLNLTADQKTQIKAIQQQAKADAAPLQTQVQQNREALQAAVKSDNTGQIQSLAATQGSLQGQLTSIRLTAQAKVYAVLTPAQQAQLAAMQAKLQEALKNLKALGQ
ncbi:MAG TPA: Spy/CpxP family protein refolding chaperone [Bryobacteraceae bacterium]|nr:Spy/CpxP family protein refolding chaperone [Bryobacteraceae bacterium]